MPRNKVAPHSIQNLLRGHHGGIFPVALGAWAAVPLGLILVGFPGVSVKNGRDPGKLSRSVALLSGEQLTHGYTFDHRFVFLPHLDC